MSSFLLISLVFFAHSVGAVRAQAHTARFGVQTITSNGENTSKRGPSDGKPTPQEVLTPELLLFSVVKVTNNLAEVFSASRSQGHGTGFFIGIDEKTKMGLIFTNNHVIDSSPTQAQELTLDFNTSQARPETIKAKIRFSSKIHDFAVLEFDPSKLKRAVLKYPLRLPRPGSPFFDFTRNWKSLVGTETLAIGNPYSSSNTVSFGEITGFVMDEVNGPYLQTQTPINPGNSGGPLISMKTGEVVGISTAKNMEADNMGFAIPIGAAIREFELWQEQKAKGIKPDAGDPRVITFEASPVEEGTLKIQGWHKAITDVVPDYWENFNTVLVVVDTEEGNGLKRDDIILKLNDEVIGGYPYNLLRRLMSSGLEAGLTILRDGKKMVVNVPFPSAGYQNLRSQVDFAYISGMYVGEMPRRALGRLHPGVKSLVVVKGLMNSAEINFAGGSFPPPGSLVTSVSFGGKEYEINNLFDLKKALNENRDKAYMQMRVYRSNRLVVGAQAVSMMSRRTGFPLVDGTLSTYIVPLRKIVTPMQFQMHRFRKDFQFGQEGSHTWDWREAVRVNWVPSSCEAAL